MPHDKVKINNSTIKMILNTGASVDILEEPTFNTLQKTQMTELYRS